MKPAIILHTDGDQDELIQYIADELRCHSFNAAIEIEKVKQNSPIELVSAEYNSPSIVIAEADTHHCELLACAANYMFYGAACDVPGLDGIPYPFEEDFKPCATHIQNLTRAASLICAEIARLQRLEK